MWSLVMGGMKDIEVTAKSQDLLTTIDKIIWTIDLKIMMRAMRMK